MKRQEIYLRYLICLCALTALGFCAAQVRIAGCARQSLDGGACVRCSKNYKLTASGACECAEGFVWKNNRTRRACVLAVPSACANKCGQTYISNGKGGYCHCDYYCNLYGDCCGGDPAAKDMDCRSQEPSIQKRRISSCENIISLTALQAVNKTGYRPGMCWCDEYCKDNKDCCNATLLKSASNTAPAPARAAPAPAVVSSSSSNSDGSAPASSADGQLSVAAITERIRAQAAALEHEGHHDCGLQRKRAQLLASVSIADATVRVANSAQAETIMQQCQATDQGPPAEPYVIPIYWVRGRICDNSGACQGGDYDEAKVQEQIDFNNAMFQRFGITFTWDGVIHDVSGGSMSELDNYFFICNLERYTSDRTAIHVLTTPEHLGGALGYTWYASEFAYSGMDMCQNWVHIYEKTLPNLGGISKVDGGLADSGYVLAHEIGHQLMLHHTWHENAWPTTAQQCAGSASLDPNDIVGSRSDGVRDTTPQPLNLTSTPTNILRFVNCDPDTGAYTNTTQFAQQACTTETGYPRGDNYLNNINNLMSYGDRTCLRTLTPGQGARARCAVKCMMQMAC